MNKTSNLEYSDIPDYICACGWFGCTEELVHNVYRESGVRSCPRCGAEFVIGTLET